ncbi:hypothetical protein GGR92_003045 [Spirosoma lacussanchae]|nr:hypothetical protein [Spirosoma lacussanchae]
MGATCRGFLSQGEGADAPVDTVVGWPIVNAMQPAPQLNRVQ